MQMTDFDDAYACFMQSLGLGEAGNVNSPDDDDEEDEFKLDEMEEDDEDDDDEEENTDERSGPSQVSPSSIEALDLLPDWDQTLQEELGWLDEEDVEAAVATLLEPPSFHHNNGGSSLDDSPDTVSSGTTHPMSMSTPLRASRRTAFTSDQYEQLQQLLRSHYQLLIQQTVLAVRAARPGAKKIVSESSDDLAEIVDGAVGMLQDLDQNRKDAIRHFVQQERMSQGQVASTSAQRSLFGNADTATASSSEDTIVNRRLTRAQFSKTLSEQSQGEYETVFDIPGISRLSESLAKMDQSVASAPSSDGSPTIFTVETNAEACALILNEAGGKYQSQLDQDVSPCFVDIRDLLGPQFRPPCNGDQMATLRRNKVLFTSGEDNLILRGVNLYGEKQWALISDRFLPDRSHNVISQRYSKLCYMLYRANGISIDSDGNLEKPPKLDSPDDLDERAVSRLKKVEPPAILNVHRWSMEEDLTLLKAVPQFGHMWAELGARLIPHRDRGHLRKRYQVLERRVKATVSRVKTTEPLKVPVTHSSNATSAQVARSLPPAPLTTTSSAASTSASTVGTPIADNKAKKSEQVSVPMPVQAPVPTAKKRENGQSQATASRYAPHPLSVSNSNHPPLHAHYNQRGAHQPTARHVDPRNHRASTAVPPPPAFPSHQKLYQPHGHPPHNQHIQNSKAAVSYALTPPPPRGALNKRMETGNAIARPPTVGVNKSSQEQADVYKPAESVHNQFYTHDPSQLYDEPSHLGFDKLLQESSDEYSRLRVHELLKDDTESLVANRISEHLGRSLDAAPSMMQVVDATHSVSFLADILTLSQEEHSFDATLKSLQRDHDLNADETDQSRLLDSASKGAKAENEGKSNWKDTINFSMQTRHPVVDYGEPATPHLSENHTSLLSPEDCCPDMSPRTPTGVWNDTSLVGHHMDNPSFLAGMPANSMDGYELKNLFDLSTKGSTTAESKIGPNMFDDGSTLLDNDLEAITALNSLSGSPFSKRPSVAVESAEAGEKEKAVSKRSFLSRVLERGSSTLDESDKIAKRAKLNL
jgi:hypothetical protein